MMDDKAAEQRLAELARQQAETVPEDVAVRLQSIRRQAVNGLEENPVRTPINRLFPGPVMAAVGVAFMVVVGVWFSLNTFRSTSPELPEIALGSDIEVAVVQELELLEELEFLAWLEEESQGAG